MSPARPRVREVVLVGGGHAHAISLRKFLMEPLPQARVTLVVDEPLAVYSGMVPGFIGGHYRAGEVSIDVHSLARRARAAVIHARATRIDATERLVHLEGRPPIRFDLASLNVGSTVAALDAPGVREHALATRPIGRFVEAFPARLEAARVRAGSRPLRVVVVGGGAAGIELSFALRARVKDARITLVEAGPRLLPERALRVERRLLAAASARAIDVKLGTRAVSVTERELLVEGGPPIEHDLVLWAPGAAPFSWLRESGLPTDSRGYVRVRSTLAVSDAEGIFAAGDCAVFDGGPVLPRSGVYAVRQGPILAHNIRARLEDRALEHYVPQTDFLALLNLGDGTAVGTKWGFSFEGSWVFKWKDRIDREFVERFRPPSPTSSGRKSAGPGSMVRGEMCGGCAAKLRQSALEAALARIEPRSDPDVLLGLAQPDDVAVLRRPGEVVVTTIDAFPAFTDDPWLVGRVAAANAVSDVEAKGVAPRLALALVTVPAHRDGAEVLFQVLSGARATLDAAGATLAGGHTTIGPELVVGFAVTGFAADLSAIMKKAGLRPGDALVLSRAVGNGVLLHADMEGQEVGRWIGAALAGMTRGSRAASEVLRRVSASAATDVTGFGLAGHLLEMLRAGGVSAELSLGAIPALPGSVELLAKGVRTPLHEANRAIAVTPRDGVERLAAYELLFDPQTAGGLLFGVAPDRAEEAVRALREAGETQAAVIGRALPATGRPSLVVGP